MLPEFGPILWIFFTVIEAIIGMALFLLFVFWFMPPISRRFIAIKWKKGSVAFIQHGGRVSVYSSNEELPEGVIHNAHGWFLKSVQPYGEEEQQEEEPKTDMQLLLERFPNITKEANAEKRMRAELKKIRKERKLEKKLNPQHSHKEEVRVALDKVLRAPILDGLGKQAFFGSSDTALLGNLDTLAELTPQTEEKTHVKHSLLTVLKAIIPATMNRTQIDAIATLNYLRGLKVGKGELMRLILVVVCLIGLIGTIGVVFWFLTS